MAVSQRGLVFKEWFEALPDDHRKKIDVVLQCGARVRRLTAECNRIRSERGERIDAEHQLAQQKHHKAIASALENLKAAHGAPSSPIGTPLQALRDLVNLHEEWTATALRERSQPEETDGQFADHRAALSAFNETLEKVKADFDEVPTDRKVKVSWQVCYSLEIDPFDQAAAVEFAGGKITDKDGRDVWADECSCCTWPIQEGLRRGVGAERLRCMDCSFAVLCALCASVQKVLSALPRAEVEAVFPEPKFRHASHLCVTETNHPVFLRHNTWDSHTIPTLLYRATINYGPRPLFGTRKGDKYEWMTFSGMWTAAHRIARAISGLLPSGSFVALSGKNSTNWYLADIACALCDYTSVGIAPSLDEADVLSVLTKSRATALICAHNELDKFVAMHSTHRTGLKWLICLDAAAQAPSGAPVADLEVLIGVEGIERRVVALPIRAHAPTLPERPTNEELSALDKRDFERHNRLHMLIFTSGSTGRPKGAVITERNWIKDINSPDFISPLVLCSWMPAAHGADRSSVWRAMLNGGRIGFASSTLPLDDLPVLGPSFFFSPPALWCTLKHEYLVDLGSGTPEAEAKLRIRKIIGDRCQWLGTGAAAIPPGLIDWMKDVFGLRVAEAYGTTEVGGISCDGKKSAETEVKLADVPDLGYFSTDQPYPRGELLARSPILIPGYFEEAEETSKGFEGGWFHTGDIVEMRSPEDIVIIDRKSSIFKMPNGEFVSLARTEGAYLSEHIRQVCLAGDPSCPSLIAIVVPSRAMRESCPDDVLLEGKLLAVLRQQAAEAHLRACEIPGGLLIDRDDWTPENGLMSAVYKFVRRRIQARHAGELRKRFAALTLSPPPLAPSVRESAGLATAVVPDKVVQIAEHLLARQVDRSVSFVANGGDSLTGASFLLRLRAAFPSAQLSIDFICNAPLSDVSAEASGDRRLASWRSLTDAALLAQISADIQPPDVPNRVTRSPAPAGQRHVLLTGATGFLGSHLLHTLLTVPAVSVTCLVRAPNDSEAAKRLQVALKGFQVSLPHDLAPSRLRVLAGDLNQPQLGLPEERYRKLQTTLTDVLHCAAEVKFGAPYASLREANVIATGQIAVLCATADPPIALHHVSSLSVFGSEGESIAQPETASMPTLATAVLQRCSDGYAQSKCAAEMLLRAFAARHASIRPRLNIYRCGFISWHQSTGVSHPSDWLTLLLSAIMATSSYPDARCALSLAPVDFVAEAIRDLLLRDPDAQSGTPVYHICSPNAIPLTTLCAYLTASGVALRPLPMRDFVQAIAKIHSRRDLVRLFPLLEGGLPHGVAPSDAHTRPLLRHCCPIVSQESFAMHKIYLSHLNETSV